MKKTGNGTKKKKKVRQNNRCPYCGAAIQMVHKSEMDFEFDIETAPEYYWRCSNYPECDAYVAADRTTKQPFGSLAREALRQKRRTIHQWKDILERESVMSKKVFLMHCGAYMGIRNPEMVHIRDMTEYICDQILGEMGKMWENSDKVKAAVERNKFSGPWRQVHGIDITGKKGIFMDEDGNPIERPDDSYAYLPSVTMGIENSKKIAQVKVKAPPENQKRMRELAHQYVVEAQKFRENQEEEGI